MNRRTLSDLIFLAVNLILFFYIFWYLIYFEKSSTLVFGSFALLVVLALISLIRSWKGAEEFGFRFKNLGVSLKAIVFPAGMLVLGSCLIAFSLSHKVKFPKLNDFLTFFIWGFFQQCIVQGYCYRTFESIFQKRRAAIFLTALVFSLLHLPNFSLMTVTFLGGLYLSFLFSKYRNLFSAGLMHGVISLTLVMTLKPAGWVPNYRMGPEPMPSLRRMLHQYADPGASIGGYSSSNIPSILEHEFKASYHALGSESELNQFLAQKAPLFVVLSDDDYKRFQAHDSTRAVYLWKSSLIWRRKFPNMKREILRCVLTLNAGRLHQLFRTRMVLISNKPPPI